MCDIDDPPAHVVVAEANDYKQQSRNNPEGVQFFDHLWQEVESIDYPLTVVLRTKSETFDDVPIKVVWLYLPKSDLGPYTTSQLLFDLPDEIYRRIQSRHAQAVRTRFFGDNSPVDLLEAFRSPDNRDETRQVHFVGYYQATPTVIDNDWATLKEAIRLTAECRNGQLGGQSVMVNDNQRSVALARVNENRLEVFITSHVESRINWQWNGELGNLLGGKNRLW